MKIEWIKTEWVVTDADGNRVGAAYDIHTAKAIKAAAEKEAA